MIKQDFIDTCHIIQQRNIPDPSKVEPEEYNKHVANPFARSIMTDIALLGGFDWDGDIMSIQGIRVVFNIECGIFMYTNDHDIKFPEHAYLCTFVDNNSVKHEIIILAESKDKIIDVLNNRKLMVDTNSNKSMKLYLESKVADTAFNHMTNVVSSIDQFDIENSIEITNPEDCRVIKPLEDNRWILA